ncbi:MAG TPA: hypothetical protein VLF59_02875 [Candidatus Saccharimonadales bacterium]|nr:hypothetical protein [Candidatus Saccharimonadales bacterium]
MATYDDQNPNRQKSSEELADDYRHSALDNHEVSNAEKKRRLNEIIEKQNAEKAAADGENLGGQETAAIGKNSNANRKYDGADDKGLLESKENQVGKGYKKDNKNAKTKGWSQADKKKLLKRGGIFTVATGTAVGGSLLGLSMLSGPARLIQNSHMLQSPFSLGNKNSSSSYGRLFRYARAARVGKVSETRLNALGSKYFGKAKADLAKSGVTITEDRLTGFPTRTNIDVAKLKTKFPEMKGMGPEATKRFLANKLGVSATELSGSGNKLFIDQHKYSVSDARLLAKSTIANLGDGSGLFGMKTRSMMTAYKLPNGLLHPLDKKIAEIERKALLAGKTPSEADKEATDAENEKVKAINEPITERGLTAVEDVKASSAKFNSIAMKALLFTGGVCMVREVADKIITVNHDVVAMPAAAASLRMVAIGEQMQYGGNDVSLEELGTVSRQMGPSFESARAYEALGDGKAHTGDPDINADYQQAFSTHTTAATFRDFASTALGGETIAGAVCSPIGIGVQLVGGIALSLGSVVAEAGSAGTLTPVVVGSWAAKEGISTAISAVATHFLENFILKKTTVTLAANAFKGPEGANLIAYGAREAANMTGIVSGGVDVGNTTSTFGLAEAHKAEMDQFRSQSFFARMFNPYSEHSLLGHLALSVSPSFSQNLASLPGTILNIGTIVPHMFSSLIPRANAAEQPYNWTFGQIGIPNTIENDPNLQDPNDNAENHIAPLFSSACAAGTNGTAVTCSYADRIMACFGNSLILNDSQWDVVGTNDVDEHSQAYHDAHCNDIGSAHDTTAGNEKGTWRRIVRWVFDTHTMNDAACYQGEGSACAQPLADGAVI